MSARLRRRGTVRRLDDLVHDDASSSPSLSTATVNGGRNVRRRLLYDDRDPADRDPDAGNAETREENQAVATAIDSRSSSATTAAAENAVSIVSTAPSRFAETDRSSFVAQRVQSSSSASRPHRQPSDSPVAYADSSPTDELWRIVRSAVDESGNGQPPIPVASSLSPPQQPSTSSSNAAVTAAAGAVRLARNGEPYADLLARRNWNNAIAFDNGDLSDIEELASLGSDEDSLPEVYRPQRDQTNRLPRAIEEGDMQQQQQQVTFGTVGDNNNSSRGDRPPTAATRTTVAGGSSSSHVPARGRVDDDNTGQGVLRDEAYANDDNDERDEEFEAAAAAYLSIADLDLEEYEESLQRSFLDDGANARDGGDNDDARNEGTAMDDPFPHPHATRQLRDGLQRGKEYETNVGLFAELYGCPDTVVPRDAFSAYHPEAVRLWHTAVVAALCAPFANDSVGAERALDLLRRDAMILDQSLTADNAVSMTETQLHDTIESSVLWQMHERFGPDAPMYDMAKYRDLYVAVARLVVVYRYAQHCSRNRELVEYAVRKVAPKQYAILLRRDRLKDRIPLRFGLFVQLMLEQGHVPEGQTHGLRYPELMPSRLLADYQQLFHRPAAKRVFAAVARPQVTAFPYVDESGACHAEEPIDSALYRKVSSKQSHQDRCFFFSNKWCGTWGVLWRAMNAPPYERSNRSRLFDQQYASRSKRFESFVSCAEPVLRSKSDRLADAGFFWSAHSDYVRCFSCGGTLNDWHERSDPMMEHVRAYPRCDYVYTRLVDPLVYRAWMVSVDSRERRSALPDSLRLLPYPYRRASRIFVCPLQKNLFRNVTEIEQPDGRALPALDLEFYRDPFFYRTDSRYVSLDVETMRRDNEYNEIHGKFRVPAAVASSSSASSSSPSSSSNSASTATANSTGHRCAVCLDRLVRVAFVPCGHAVTCLNCSSRIKDCCVCRTRVERSVQLYFS